MRSALWEMKPLGNCLPWTPKEVTCLIRFLWKHFLLFKMHKGLHFYLFLFVCLYIFRPWLKIRVMSGLPNTTDRKLPLELLELASKIVYHDFHHFIQQQIAA